MVNKTIKKGERGINYLKTIVDQYECFFHKIDQENDVGLDGFIEFTKNGDETGKIVAIQVKNGSSYNTAETCKFPIDGHERYWSKCVVPVYGIVMNEDDNKDISSAYWVDIKSYLKENSEKNMIIYPKALCNKLTRGEFENFFCEIILNGCPCVDEETLLSLLNSKINLDVEYAIKAIDFHNIRNPVLTRKLILIISSTSNRSVIHDILNCLISFSDNEIEKNNLLPMLNISHVLEYVGEEDYSLLCPFFIKDINSISYILNNIISVSNLEHRFQLEEIMGDVICKQHNRFYNEENYWKNVLLVLSNGLAVEACMLTISTLFSNPDSSISKSTSSKLRNEVRIRTKKVIPKILNSILDEVVKTSEDLGRGTLSQAVESIISSIDDKEQMLMDFIYNVNNEKESRVIAAYYFAYYFPEKFIDSGSFSAFLEDERIEILKECIVIDGEILLY
ncbi:DUF4365 domain-containing protein [Enterococcus sp. BWB1-3]|uniref:DUF4365 domain-containing protein n=1 Tax=Enterococcus sp. BWB1-3 TaxID=2787713 RepID=UPI001F1DA7C9|nr:DUF4365 domain-containing protein [Enterococcus sp. BWB1-3]